MTAATSLEPRDHRFLLNALTEQAPTAFAGRLVHYSTLSGTLNAAGDRVSQWNDVSGSSRTRPPTA